MEVVRPLRIQPVPAAIVRIQYAGIVEVALADHGRRPASSRTGIFGRFRDGAEDVACTEIEDGVDGIHPEAINVELLQPHPDVVQDVVAHRVAAMPVIVDGRAPRGLVAIVEVAAEFAQIIPLRAEVVVDHIQEDGEAFGVAGVYEPLKAVRPAVAVLSRIGEHAVISPVAGARELADRHDLDGGDAQIAELAQPRDDRLECPFRSESADVQLVEDEIFSTQPLPIAVAPGEPPRDHDRRGTLDTLGLPERAGVCTFGTIAQSVGVSLTRDDPRLGVAIVSAFFRLHGDFAPGIAIDQDEAYSLRPGRPDTPMDRTVTGPDRPASPHPPAIRPLNHGDRISPHSMGFFFDPTFGIHLVSSRRP